MVHGGRRGLSEGGAVGGAYRQNPGFGNVQFEEPIRGLSNDSVANVSDSVAILSDSEGVWVCRWWYDSEGLGGEGVLDFKLEASRS